MTLVINFTKRKKGGNWFQLLASHLEVLLARSDRCQLSELCHRVHLPVPGTEDCVRKVNFAVELEEPPQQILRGGVVTCGGRPLLRVPREATVPPVYTSLLSVFCENNVKS